MALTRTVRTTATRNTYILYRVWIMKAPFGLLIGFINNPPVVTTRNYYTVTHLHSLQSLHANSPFYLFGASGIHLEIANR
jgi:hypothetical protein